MKKLIAIILTLTIACQSLSLNVFANSAEIEDILSYVQSDLETPNDIPEDVINNDTDDNETFQPYDEWTQNDDFEYISDNVADSTVITDTTIITDTAISRISVLLGIDAVSAQNMIFAYGGEEIALYEAENYAQLKEIFYALDYSDVRDELLELVICGYGSQRVAYSGIVASVLQANINDVILKDGEEISDDDIYIEYFTQQLCVSPLFVASYTLETGLSTEVMYNLVVSALHDMYPNVFAAAALSNDSDSESSIYPNSPFYVNLSENERISPVSGALTYVMNLAAIPGVNGMDIDLSLRYDSDRSVAQGEYKVKYGGQTNPDGSVVAYSIHEYDPFDWNNKSPFMFGTGWRLNYDYIYRRDSSLLLILSDGREYEITGTSPNYTLKGFNSGSLTLTGIEDANTATKYRLRFFDGTIEEFNGNGELLSKTDRYGNSITFSHEKITNSEPYTDKLAISDTHSTVDIYYNLTSQKIVLPDGSIILLNYIRRNNDYLLSSITNQVGESTAFTYQSYLCGPSDCSSTSYNPPGTYYLSFQKLYYNYLTEISHPTGAKTAYTYTSHTISRISSREYTANGETYNNISYTYSVGSNSTVDYGSKVIEYSYNYKGLVTQETIKDDGNIKGWVSKKYDNNLGLPTSVITAFTKHTYGQISGYEIWTDGQGHGGTYPVYDTTSYSTKQDTYQYDSVGQIVKQIVNGVTTTNTYDSTYHVLKKSISSGSDGKTIRTENTLSSDKKSIVWSNAYYNNISSSETAYTYDNHGNPITVYNCMDLESAVCTQNVYSDSGRLLSTTTAKVKTKYTYDLMGRVTSKTEGIDSQVPETEQPVRTTSYQYDALGRLIKETYAKESYEDEVSKTYSYTVGTNVNKTVVTDELGFKTTYNYNGLGDIISVYSENQCLETTSYDSYRRVSSRTDGNGATTQYTYDYADRVTNVAIQNTAYNEQYSYDLNHETSQFITRKTVVGDNVPTIKTVSYTDIYGRLIAEGAVVGSAEWLNSYTYDSFGNKIQELSANDSYNNRSFTNKYTYDGNGNVTSVCNALNQYTYKTYDWLGNMLTETDLSGNVTTYTYDDFGRVLTKTVPVDADRKLLVTNSYDKCGNLTSETVSEKGENSTIFIRSAEYTYDLRNNLLEVKTYGLLSDPLSTTTYTYDKKGQVLSSTTGGYATSYTYDGRGNTLSITYPGEGVETFTYNAANNVISSTDRNGVTTSYSYNLLGKPTSITAGGKTKSYTYASNGSVLSETSESGTISYTYDNIGRVTSETSGGKTTTYTYDRAGNVLTTSTPSGSFTANISYTYDALNRLVGASAPYFGATYTYNTAGHRASTTVKHPMGTVSQTTYAYNNLGAITALINCNAEGDILSQFTYTYDVLGNTLTAYDSTTGKTANYAYDALGRLIYEKKGGTTAYYEYDEAGNRTKAIVDTANTIYYTYDSDGRLIRETQSNGQTSTVIDYTYDANGNLTSKTDGIVTTTYTFDVWGNMTSAAGASYTYNVQGLRTSKTVGNKTTNFTLVNGKVYGDSSDNYYVWGLELITNGSVYYLYNAHGDVIQLINSNGTVTKTYDYDAYGNELTRDLNDSNPFRYCGEYYDTETGFIYLRARYYNPSTGRFISVDPIHDGLNWYAYANNNPLLYVDPSGLSAHSGGPVANVDRKLWYLTKEEAAYAFGVENNAKSFERTWYYRDGREFGAAIYSRVFYYYDGKYYSIMQLLDFVALGEIASLSDFFRSENRPKTTLYSCGTPIKGKTDSIRPKYDIKNGRIVGAVHTHGAWRAHSDDEFSDGDLEYAMDVCKFGYRYVEASDEEKKELPNWKKSKGISDFEIFVVTPSGYLKRYSPATEISPSEHEKDISDSVPHTVNIPNSVGGLKW